MLRFLKKAPVLILVVSMVSGCLSSEDDLEKTLNSPPPPISPSTALATLKVVDDLGGLVSGYNLQISSGTNDLQVTDVDGIAVMMANLNGDNPMTNDGSGPGLMDSFVYFTLTGDTDFSTNPIIAPLSTGPLDNWCYNQLDPGVQSDGGFIRVYKSSDAAVLFQDSDLLTVSITLFNATDDLVLNVTDIDTANDLADAATVGLPYIDIWHKDVATGHSPGHRNVDVPVFSHTDPNKYAVATVDLNSTSHTVDIAPCGASFGVLSIIYF